MIIKDWKPIDKVQLPDWAQKHIDNSGDAKDTPLTKEENQYLKALREYKESDSYLPEERTSYKQIIKGVVDNVSNVPDKS